MHASLYVRCPSSAPAIFRSLSSKAVTLLQSSISPRACTAARPLRSTHGKTRPWPPMATAAQLRPRQDRRAPHATALLFLRRTTTTTTTKALRWKQTLILQTHSRRLSPQVRLRGTARLVTTPGARRHLFFLFPPLSRSCAFFFFTFGRERESVCVFFFRCVAVGAFFRFEP